MKTVKKICVIAPALVLFCAILFTGCPQSIGGRPSGGTQSGPDPNLKIEGTVLKGYRGEKPTGVLNVPAGITKIASFAFWNCAGLTQVNFPSSLKTIGESAFSGCTGLTSLTLPSSSNLEAIDRFAFSGCTGLTGTLSLPTSLKTISGTAFKGCTNLEHLTMTSVGTHLLVEADIVYTKDKKKLLCTIPNVASVTFPAGLEKITAFAFKDCTRLTSLSLPSSLKTIDESAFSGCTGLTSLTLPSSSNLEAIDRFAFSGCIELTGTVSFPANLKVIGFNAFSGCKKVNEFDFLSCTMPPLVLIDTGAFSNCSPSAVYKVKSNSSIWNLLLNSQSGISLLQIMQVP